MKELFNKIDVDPDEFAIKASEILGEVKEILIKKNRDYGGASFDMGLVSNYVHIHDKENRLKTLIEKFYSEDQTPNFESIEDTYRDLIGYSVIGLIIFEHMKKETKEPTLETYSIAKAKERGTSFSILSDMEEE